jgi:hypothetical protein
MAQQMRQRTRKVVDVAVEGRPARRIKVMA